MFDICAMGEILVDAIAQADSSVHITANAGGAPANVLACASNLGLDTTFIAKAGDDYIGRWLKEVLEKAGIHTAGMVLDPDRNTTIAMVSLNAEGNRAFSFYRSGCADVSLSQEEIDIEMIDQSRVFHFGSVSLTEEPSRSATLFAAKYAKEHGVLVSYDPNLRKNLWSDEAEAHKYIMKGLQLCDVAKLADEECTFLYGDDDLPSIAHQMLKDFPNLKLLFVTCGADGSYAFTEDTEVYVPGFSVKAVDTTGAGDSFVGAALYQLICRDLKLDGFTAEELEGIVRFCNGVGALTVQKYGAIPAMPAKAEVEVFLSSMQKRA